MILKARYLAIFIIFILSGCGNKVQVINLAGLPIKGAKVTPISLSAGGSPSITDASGYVSLSFSAQEIKWIQVDCVGYTMVQVPVPAKYPLIITLR